MEERYRKLICPNGHSSDAIGENDPLPRRCNVCGQQYLKNVKPIWCDKNGNEIKEECDSLQNLSGGRRKRTSFLDSLQENEEMKPDEVMPEEMKSVPVNAAKMGGNTFLLVSGDYAIELTGEGVLGREYLGKEIFAVNRLVSRRHCYYIATMQRGLQIRDAGSLNGTYADTGNGRVGVSKETGVSLKSGDRLWLADMLFEVKEVE